MKYKIILLITLFPLLVLSKSKQKVVAIIDSGFSFNEFSKNAKLCKFGHKDFSGQNQYLISKTTKDPVPEDIVGHGTVIEGIIEQNSKDFHDYCIVIIKYYKKGYDCEQASINAIKHAINIKADYINYSGGGTDFSKEEQKVVKRFLDNGGTFVAAAGNESSDLNKLPYYPAMDDDRVIVVGNLLPNGKIAPQSNYGKRVNRWEVGTKVLAYGQVVSGTSMSAAIVTGKLLNKNKK